MKELLIALSLLICSQRLISQEIGLTIDANILTVISMDESDEYLSKKKRRMKIFQPAIITFGCYLSNHSDKRYLFDSNTVQCFRNGKVYKDELVMGHFYLVNKQDSLLLFSRSTGMSGGPEGKSVPVWANCYESLSFRKFLNRFSSNDEQKSKKELFDYLRKSILVYVPIQKDYEQVIKNSRIEKDSIIYPTEPIVVKMPDPFRIDYSVMYNESDIDVYSD